MFHQLLRYRCEVEFLTIRERRRFESIATSWAKPLSHARTSLYTTRVGYHSSYSKMSLDRATRSGERLLPGSSEQACPRSKPGSSGHACPWSTSPLHIVLSSPQCDPQSNPHLERGTWLHGRNEFIRPLCARYIQSQPRARQ
jgi:hypothetical protein